MELLFTKNHGTQKLACQGFQFKPQLAFTNQVERLIALILQFFTPSCVQVLVLVTAK